ncbi:hypothetical protein [uncultured Acinetobacter sp.]|uniref:hypothetical protein n=1 Tax=uncultured Acinetobacter sp. TaxID=165433 RepID=UPI0037498CC0
MEDPQIVSAIINAQLTSVATIKAAYWTSGAALISAFIGALGIVFAAWYAWQSGMKLQQHNNIIEAKREVYLDAIAKYQQLTADLKLVTYAPDKFHEIYLSNKKDFLVSINKVQLICDGANKPLVLDFKNTIDNKIIELYGFFELFLESYYSLILFKEKLELANKDLNNFLTENPKFAQGKILHTGLHLSVTKLQNTLQKSQREHEIAKIGYEFNLEQINKKIQDFEVDLNDKYINFSNMLRAELKIEN